MLLSEDAIKKISDLKSVKGTHSMLKPTCVLSIANVCSGMNAAFLPEAAVAARERVVYCDRMVAVDNDFIGTILLF